MPGYQNNQPLRKEYDPRWLIWTIVFLVSSGTALVSYIIISDINENTAISEVRPRVLTKTAR